MTCPQLGFADLVLRAARTVRNHPVMTALATALVLGNAVLLSVFGPHPFIDVNRVSIPYGLKVSDLGVAVIVTAFTAAAAGTAPFLTARVVGRYVYAVACVTFAVGLAAATASILRLQRLAYVLLSPYVAGVPLTKVTYVALAVTAVVTGAWAVKEFLREPRRLNEVKHLTSVSDAGEGLRLGDALLAWLTAFIILMIPYYPWINPRGVYVDVDHIYYWRWLHGTDWGNILVRLLAFGRGDRPLFVGLVFLATRVMPFHAFDVLYVAGAGALIPVLAEGVARRAGLGRWFGFAASLLGSVPLYFVFGGYHANLAAMCLTLAILYWRLGWRVGEGTSYLRRLALLSIASLVTAMTHSEAWVLYTPLLLIDAPTIAAWVAGGASWLVTRELLISPKYVVLAHNLLWRGAPTITQLDLQLVIMLWGVPATWLTYVAATAGIVRAWRDGALRKYSPFLTSTALTLIPLLTLTPRFMVHRVLMNTAYWFFTAYALSRAWGSRRLWWVVPLYIGLQWAYAAWLLSNAVPVKPP